MIFDIEIATTPLTQYVAVQRSHENRLILDAFNLEYNNVFESCTYYSHTHLFLSVPVADYLLAQLRSAGIQIRTLHKVYMPRFEEEVWRRTNGIIRNG